MRGLPPTKVGHVADVVFFRIAGSALIAHEVVPKAPADWQVIVAGFAMFFMPDALRGRQSLVWALAARVIGVDPRSTYPEPGKEDDS